MRLQEEEKMVQMGFIGAGAIAVKMANTIKEMDTVNRYAVSSRDIDRAQEFAKEHGFEKAYGSYEEMLKDPKVELIYIATPHSHHYAHVKMCLEAGKHVLCEKPFTVTSKQAEELFKMAEEKGLLLTEALWTRYMPSRKMIDDIIKSGVIGEVTALTAVLSYELHEINRLWDPALAGGALMDLGVYLIHFARMVMGTNITDIHSHAVMQQGVDITDSMTLVFDENKTATLQSCQVAISDRLGCIFGTEGYIRVLNVNNPEEIRVFDKDYNEIGVYIPEKQITGYEYEVSACVKAIQEGKTECEEIPHSETVEVLKIMEDMRKSWGYEIPVM